MFRLSNYAEISSLWFFKLNKSRRVSKNEILKRELGIAITFWELSTIEKTF